MATRYGYDKAIGLTGPLSVNWQELTNSTVKYLNEIQEKKGTEKKELAKQGRDLAVKLSENPFDYTSNMFGFYGKAANGAIDLFGGIEKDYADRKISKTDRDIKIANGKSQMEQYISASTLYAEQEKERAKKAGPNGTYGAEDIFENQILSESLNYENIEPMWDPDSATFNALVTFKDGTKRIMSSNQLYRAQQRPEIGKYDMNKNIKEQFETIGVKTKESADGSIITGNFVTTQGEEADNALKNLAEAMVQQPTQLRSMLSTYPISVEEDGKVNTYKFNTIEFLPQEAYDIGTGEIKKDVLKKLLDDNPTIFYRDTQGNYYESDKAKEIGEKYAMERLMLAADYKEKETPAEKILTDEEKQYNLIRKYSFIASYGDDVPQDFVDNLLTKEEQESYKTYKENLPQGGGLTDLLSTIGNQINFSSLKEEGKSEVLPFLQEALKPFGMTVEISGGGARLNNGVIQLTYGDSGTVNVEFKDSFGKIKTDQQMINDIITAMQVFKPLKELGYNMAIKDAQPTEPILN